MSSPITDQDFSIYARLDLPSVRSKLRIQMIDARFSARFIGRTVTVFTGLADALFTVNSDQKILIHFVCHDDQERHIQLEGSVPGAASKLNLIAHSTEALKRIVDDFEILPKDGDLQITVGLVER